MVSRVDVLLNREVIFEGIAVTSGQVTYDLKAARLARLSLTVADPLRLPVAADDILSPFGYELLVQRGVMLPSGPELIPLGVFPIQNSSADGVTLVSSIVAEDRSRLVSDARFESRYTIAAASNYATAIQAMIASRVDGLEYLFPSTTFTSPLLTFDSLSDPWEGANQMAKYMGNYLAFDGLGRLTSRPEPTFTATPVAEIVEGKNMTSAVLDLDRTGAYNRVTATSNNASTGEVFEATATDDDPSSPTYYFGTRFGKKPRGFYSEFIGSNAQAASAAASILAANLGVSRSVRFSAIPDPRLEVGDVVLLKRTQLGIDELHIIDTLTIGLGADSTMSGTSRTQQDTP